MELQNVSTSFGQCRCCFGKGNHMDIMKEYYISGKREVYLDIFMDCFNLFLCTNTNITTLICHSCVKSLRDANNFKTMVVKAEKQLLQTVRDDNQTLFVNVPVTTRVDETDLDIKLEVETNVKRELTDSEFETEEHVGKSIIEEHNHLVQIGVNAEHNNEALNDNGRSNPDNNIKKSNNKESSSPECSSKKGITRNSKELSSKKRKSKEGSSKKCKSKERSNGESKNKVFSSKDSNVKELSATNSTSKKRSSEERNSIECSCRELSRIGRNIRKCKKQSSKKCNSKEACSEKGNRKELSNKDYNCKVLDSRESNNKEFGTKNLGIKERRIVERSDKRRKSTEPRKKAGKSKKRNNKEPKCKNKEVSNNERDIEDHKANIDEPYDDYTDSDNLPLDDYYAMLVDPEKVKHQNLVDKAHPIEIVDSAKVEDRNLVDGEADLIARYSRASLYQTCANYVMYLDKLKDKIVTAKDVAKLLKEPAKKKTLRRKEFVTEKSANVNNVTTLLECSNLTAFKTRMKSGFPCFYCRTIFDNFAILREHQQKEHKDFDIRNFVSKYTADCLIVYVDVADLKCTLCDEEISNLKDLKEHLIKKHKKKIHLDYPDRIIPFKFTKNSYECQICSFGFETFGAIERHMNVHYRNFVCEECGAAFITRHRLKVHTYTLHTGRSYPCESCKKVFTSHQKHKIHVASVHKNVKGYKCAKCDERFIDYFTRQKHMVEFHDAAPIQYRCNVCFKQFNRKYALFCHTKRKHLVQRDFECTLCDYKGFDKHELQAHMAIHSGKKEYECSFCQKAFARKKNLKEHLKRHTRDENDKGLACEVCGRTFMQNSGLKAHMKSHNYN